MEATVYNGDAVYAARRCESKRPGCPKHPRQWLSSVEWIRTMNKYENELKKSWPNDTRDGQSRKQTIIADGGQTPTDLTRFQLDVLGVLAEQARYGLAIKRELEELYGVEEVNHGRLYPNLDELVEAGLIEKSELDKRTNEYAISDDGVALLRERLGWMADNLGVGVETGEPLPADAGTARGGD